MTDGVFLIGASGFLGGTVLDDLLARGVRVTALVHDRAPEARGPFPTVRGDLDNPAGFADALAGHAVAIHAGSLAPEWGPYAQHRNSAGRRVRALLDALAEARVKRLVLVSAAEVYGNGLSGDVDEEHPMARTGQLCGDSHADAEALALDAHRAGRLEVAVVRAALCYGARDRTFLPRLVEDIASGTSAIIGDGSARPVLCDATALAGLIWLAATQAPAAGQVYNAADLACSLTWADLLGSVHGRIASRFPLRRVPAWLARIGAAVGESGARLVGAASAPRLTRHVVEILTARHTLSVVKARALGWNPCADTAPRLLDLVQYRAPRSGAKRGTA